MIEITAGNLYAYYLIMKDVENLTSTEITEKQGKDMIKKELIQLLEN